MSFAFLRSTQAREPFRIIFADPPYEKAKSGGEFTSLLLEDAQLAEILEPSGIFVLEKRPAEQMPRDAIVERHSSQSVRRHRSACFCNVPAFRAKSRNP